MEGHLSAPETTRTDLPGRVRLTIPAETAWLRLARLLVAGVASRMGFDLDAIDDVQIAVDELCQFLLAADGVGTIVLECAIGEAILEVVGVASVADAATGPARPDDLGRRILDAVVDTYECAHAPRQFRFVKRRR